jgi:hypothetical protein
MTERKGESQIPDKFTDIHGLEWQILLQRFHPPSRPDYFYRQIVRVSEGTVLDQKLVTEESLLRYLAK